MKRCFAHSPFKRYTDRCCHRERCYHGRWSAAQGQITASKSSPLSGVHFLQLIQNALSRQCYTIIASGLPAHVHIQELKVALSMRHKKREMESYYMSDEFHWLPYMRLYDVDVRGTYSALRKCVSYSLHHPDVCECCQEMTAASAADTHI